MPTTCSQPRNQHGSPLWFAPDRCPCIRLRDLVKQTILQMLLVGSVIELNEQISFFCYLPRSMGWASINKYLIVGKQSQGDRWPQLPPLVQSQALKLKRVVGNFGCMPRSFRRTDCNDFCIKRHEPREDVTEGLLEKENVWLHRARWIPNRTCNVGTNKKTLLPNVSVQIFNVCILHDS